MDSSAMSLEQLGALAKAVPSDQERDALGAYLRGEHPDHPGMCDEELLGTVERFFVELLKVPRLEERISCMLYMRTYGPSLSQLCELTDLVTVPAAELIVNRDFALLLRVVLEVGNHMNSGTTRGQARGFKLATLLKLPDIKAADRKTSLLRYVVERGLATRPSLASLPSQLAALKAAAGIQLAHISALVRELQGGMGMLREEVASARSAQQRPELEKAAEAPAGLEGGSGTLGGEAAADVQQQEQAQQQEQQQGVRAAPRGQAQGATNAPQRGEEGLPLEDEAMSSRRVGGGGGTVETDAADADAGTADADSAFVRALSGFLETHGGECGGLHETVEAPVVDALKSLAAYFDEAYDPRDPMRTLAVVRDFMAYFASAVAAATRQ
ncbi:hypothetical protein FOA52_010354 [Chlamydomonas sp. UWO 241]|nr:hypothetical protein FOA52_010354 [Chlamydomonas sp. UWO 241]